MNAFNALMFGFLAGLGALAALWLADRAVPRLLSALSRHFADTEVES